MHFQHQEKIALYYFLFLQLDIIITYIRLIILGHKDLGKLAVLLLIFWLCMLELDLIWRQGAREGLCSDSQCDQGGKQGATGKQVQCICTSNYKQSEDTWILVVVMWKLLIVIKWEVGSHLPTAFVFVFYQNKFKSNGILNILHHTHLFRAEKEDFFLWK